MRDFFDRELRVGDAVAMTPAGYKMLMPGRVVGFTEKMVRVEYTWNGPRAITETVLRYPTDLVLAPTSGREHA